MPTEAATETPEPTVTDTPELTTTPTETPIPTATPTRTPIVTPTATSEVCPLGAYIEMPADFFSPGDLFSVSLKLCNPGAVIQNTPIFCILELYASYWFWPGWVFWHGDPIYEGIHYIRMDVPQGETYVPVISFVWPDTNPAAMDGINFLGVMTDPAITEIIGMWDSATWGFGPA
ncbi:hypothetical protein ACFL0Z_02960 [Patescibacteria group bacterium]